MNDVQLELFTKRLLIHILNSFLVSVPVKELDLDLLAFSLYHLCSSIYCSVQVSHDERIAIEVQSIRCADGWLVMRDRERSQVHRGSIRKGQNSN